MRAVPSAIDDAHYKRHQCIAEQLHAVYESCGEISWTIIPPVPEIATEEISRDTNNSWEYGTENDYVAAIAGMPPSKRGKKDAKHLTRAASRSRAITQEEIQYIDSVIRSDDGITSNETEGLRNPEEVDEIEKQLRYHAQVYNARGNRDRLESLTDNPSKMEETEFDAEMNRILNIFHITKLLKRNTNTKDLQGKELEIFLALVSALKLAITEDIVQVKKDIVEVRMRRAGYLRYVNRASYEILGDRYSTKSWKAGGKPTTSAVNPSDMPITATKNNASSSDQREDQQPRKSWAGNGSDRRHLENIHQRVNSDDGLREATIEPYQAPLLPLLPDPTPGRAPVSVRITNTKTLQQSTNPMLAHAKKIVMPSSSDGWITTINGTRSKALALRPPVWEGFPSQQCQLAETPLHTEISPLGQFSTYRNSFDESFFNAPAAKNSLTQLSKEPETFATESEEKTATEHVIVSEKKKSKKLRESKRKARRLDMMRNTEASIASKAANEEITEATDTSFCEISSLLKGGSRSSDAEEIPLALPSQDVDSIGCDIVQASKTTGSTTVYIRDKSTVPLPGSVPVTTHGKQSHWRDFVLNLTADQLTNPFLPSWGGYSYESWCIFEKNHILDCPFHPPHCSCVDPTTDQCFLIMPGDKPCTSGPYNRLRGDLSNPAWFPNLDLEPGRLAQEIADFHDGLAPGPLMKQEYQYHRLKCSNKLKNQQLILDTLLEIRREASGRRGQLHICYCNIAIPENPSPSLHEDLITCSYQYCTIKTFHKSCVKKLGMENVSRWYCTHCEKQMRLVAYKALRMSDRMDISDNASVQSPRHQNQGHLTKRFTETVDQFFSMTEDGSLGMRDLIWDRP
ncbi:hypothetical protein COCMIDRAFT_26360 [Bipolaris oryzae ATCC 44560]|uniref:Zinc finger PHD-type domain-containing protein n=1 Tax=Bipolaris oryzae ATCC 44560 TaxID=930090 RepID=W6ZP86_COCMI|nr:uncharacterized protein COCMIDRAFT_26360 [Bipolaris oryzae ATCC 44560]EUC45426.1 hypothetical protein COCMIDRAFT_26360 [Bipolaris oryzae ATCC 44560]